MEEQQRQQQQQLRSAVVDGIAWLANPRRNEERQKLYVNGCDHELPVDRQS
jgi:hypothetical protein